MSEQSPVWISEAEVVSLMDMSEAIEALEEGLRAEAAGQAQNMIKTHLAWGDGSTLHAIGASFPRAGLAGTKTWAHTSRGAAPLLILFDTEDGSLKAVIEAFALGQLRTASASGLATRVLAEKDAGDFALIGTGKQALTQLAAVLAVRPITQVRVYGRNQDRREQFAKSAEKEFEIEVVPTHNIADAVAGASTVTLVTRATEPLVNGTMFRKGAHINAIGAIDPSRAEIDQSVLARCTKIVVDNLPQAQKLSRELMEFFGPSKRKAWRQVSSLSKLIAAETARDANDDLTLFKSLGMGVSDLALGIQIYRKSLAEGLGRGLPPRERLEPRLRLTNR